MLVLPFSLRMFLLADLIPHLLLIFVRVCVCENERMTSEKAHKKVKIIQTANMSEFKSHFVLL